MSKGIPDEQFIETVRDREPAGTQEIADSVGVERQSADYRLRKLEEQGDLRSKKIGGTLVWMLVD